LTIIGKDDLQQQFTYSIVAGEIMSKYVEVKNNGWGLFATIAIGILPCHIPLLLA
jgi:hypothetical protein